jgi:hypothetical protein
LGVSAGGTVLKALKAWIRATVDPLMSRCRQHIISLYRCNQLLSYATFSEYDFSSAVACSCSLPTMQGATSITRTTKSDYHIEFQTKQFRGCAEKGIVGCVTSCPYVVESDVIILKFFIVLYQIISEDIDSANFI